LREPVLGISANLASVFDCLTTVYRFPAVVRNMLKRHGALESIWSPKVLSIGEGLTMNPVFHTFNHAYVVNLDKDWTRMERVSSRLQKLDVSFERFPALQPSRMVRFKDSRIKPGAYACAQSHAALLRLILERGHDTALILEDDVVFRDDTQELMEQIAIDLAVHPWDVFYMGLHLIRSGGRTTRHLGRVRIGFHSHAYAVCRTAIPRLLECIEQMLSDPIETFDCYQDDSLRKLYSIPILAVQEPNLSYTLDRYLNRLPQYFAVFDGDEFESHCAEMRAWKSNWRMVLASIREFTCAEKLYKSGSLEDAALGYLKALDEWPEIGASLRMEPAFPSVREMLDTDSYSDEHLLKACAWLSSRINDVLAQQF
jgi:GR25 family glycosyltransferase involved in LPS biosynthesis